MSFQILCAENDSRIIQEETSIKDVKNSNVKNTYKKNISSLIKYFRISEPCATYMFFRQKRSRFPVTSNKYLEWNITIQNALILLDRILGFNWEKLEFGEENIALLKNNIIYDKIPKYVLRNTTPHNKDHEDYEIIENSVSKGFIKKMGFYVPYTKIEKHKKYKHKEDHKG
jgi:hypothetical protein